MSEYDRLKAQKQAIVDREREQEWSKILCEYHQLVASTKIEGCVACLEQGRMQCPPEKQTPDFSGQVLWLYEEIEKRDGRIAELEARQPVDPASLTAERMCEVLNKVKHRGRDNWKVYDSGHLHATFIESCRGHKAAFAASIEDEATISYWPLDDAQIIAAYYLQGRISE